VGPEPIIACESPYIALPMGALRHFCRRWEIDRLTLAGSAARGPFRPDSDVDLVVHASYRARVFARRGTAAVAAVRELEAMTGGRRVDLVSARGVAGDSNSYVAYNLLVEHRFERRLSLLRYIEQAGAELANVSVTSAEHDLASADVRPRLLAALVVIGRVCDRDERIALLRAAGLVAVPWEYARDILLPTVEAARRHEPRPWPDDVTLAELVRRLAPHAPAMVAVARAVLAREGPIPEVPASALALARGDAPPIPRRGDPIPKTPTLALARFDDPDREALSAIAKRFRIHRLIERVSDEPHAPRVFSAFAVTRAPFYEGPGRIAAEAIRAFGALGAEVRCARRIALDRNPFAIHDAFVRDRGVPAETAAWYVREAARLLGAAPAVRAKAGGPREIVRCIVQASATTTPPTRRAWGLEDLPWERFARAESDERTAAELADAIAPWRDAMARAEDPRREGETAFVPRGLVIDALGDVTPETEAAYR